MTKLDKLFKLALFAALFAVIVGEKAMFIARCGSDLPYWDQWDAEGEKLYQPYLEGRLTAADLFAPHNEHRIFFTRVLALGLFEANSRQWDCRVQQLANTLLHASVALLLVALALRALPLWPATGFTAITAVFFSTTVSWENTLCGFQSQFYFLLLFSALHLGGTLLARPRSLIWWLAPLAGAAALFSMASGLLSAAAILAAVAIRTLRERKLKRDDIWLLAANSALCVSGCLLQNVVQGHEVFRAAGFLAWIDAWLYQLAWPVRNIWMAPLGLAAPLMLVWAFFRRRIDGPLVLTLLAACAWVGMQTAAIAYARGGVAHGYAPRYADILAIAVLVNLLAFIFLAINAPSRRQCHYRSALAAAFSGIALWGLSHEAGITEQTALQQLPEINNARITSVRNYLASHDQSFFTKAPWSELPYPSAERLAGFLDTPALRGIMPASVRPPIALAADRTNTQGFEESPKGPFAPAPLGLATWLTLPHGNGPITARFSSQQFSVDHPSVSLFVVGYTPAGSAQLRLVSENGSKYAQIQGEFRSGPRWKHLDFDVPPGRYRLEVNYTGTEWFAFTQPMTNTRLSHLAENAARWGSVLLGCGLGLGFAALVLVALNNAWREPEKT